jgi:hypothetical protein
MDVAFRQAVAQARRQGSSILPACWLKIISTRPSVGQDGFGKDGFTRPPLPEGHGAQAAGHLAHRLIQEHVAVPVL